MAYADTKKKPHQAVRVHADCPAEIVRFARVGDTFVPSLYSLHSREHPTASPCKQRAASLWARSPLDQADAPLLPTSVQVRNTLANKATSLGLGTRGTVAQLRRSLECALRGQPQVGATVTSAVGTSSGLTAGDKLAAAASLRTHADVNDGPMTNILTYARNVTDGDFFCDLFAGEMEHARGLAANDPTGVTVTAAPLRRKATGVVTAATLRRLPRRVGELRIAMGRLFTGTVHNRAHLVGPITRVEAP